MELSEDHPHSSSPGPLLMTALINTCWGKMSWIIMTTNNFSFCSGEGAGKDLWKLHPFPVPSSLRPRHQNLPQKNKFSVKITKTHTTFWKLMKNTVNLRESRRPDMRGQDKRLNGVSAVYGGDRATPRVGSPPSVYSGNGVKSLGLIVYISLDSLKWFGRTAKNNRCCVPCGGWVHCAVMHCSRTIHTGLDFVPLGPWQSFDSLGWHRFCWKKISELNYKLSLI